MLSAFIGGRMACQRHGRGTRGSSGSRGPGPIDSRAFAITDFMLSPSRSTLLGALYSIKVNGFRGRGGTAAVGRQEHAAGRNFLAAAAVTGGGRQRRRPGART